MTYTIKSAAYANAERTAAILDTAEAGAVAASPADTPDLWGKMLRAVTPAAYVAEPVPVVVTPEQRVIEALIAEGIIPAGKAGAVRDRLKAKTL